MTLVLGHLLVNRKKEILNKLDPHINIPNYFLYNKTNKMHQFPKFTPA